MNKKEFYHKLFTLVMPIAFQQFMLAAVTASDAVMLGFVSQDSLLASSLAGQITFVFNLFMGGITVGTSALAAQYYGKRDISAIEIIFAYVIKISTVIALIFCLMSMLLPNFLMRLFTDDTILIESGAVYLRVIAVSYVFTAVSQIYLCIMKNTAHALNSMIISSTAVVINIFLNGMLIFGVGFFPKMNIAGAALATVISKAIEMIWSIMESLKKGRVRLNIHFLINRSDKLLNADYWRYTAPSLGNHLVWGLGFAMYSVIMGHLGSDAVAANSIANIVKNLIACFCMGLGNGGSIIVGNELGKNELERAKEYGGLLCRLSVISGILSGGVLLAINPLILYFAQLNEQATENLKWMLILCAVYMVGKAINTTIVAGIFPAGGDSKFGMICDAVTMWIYAVPIGMCL